MVSQRGNLQDAINANVVSSRHFSEQEMLRLFRGTCLAVRAMHEYRPATPKSAAEAAASGNRVSSGANGKAPQQHDDEDDERFPQAEGDAEGGYSYDRSSVPLMTRHKPDEADVVFDGDEEPELATENHKPGSEIVPYAHRDLKPG
jgi:serine/threonine kinase 16